LLLVGVLVGAAMVGGGTPASAGGPTSLLIVEPQSGRAVAEYYDDDAYAALDAVLSDPRSTTRQSAEGDYGSRGTGRMITLTWLIHDAWIWRVNRVFPDAPDGPWVLTVVADENGELPELGTWSRVSDPTRLVAVVDRELATDKKSRSDANPAEVSRTTVATVTRTVFVAPDGVGTTSGAASTTGRSATTDRTTAMAPIAAGGGSGPSAGVTLFRTAVVLVVSAGLVLLGWAAGTGRLRRRRPDPVSR
jgi:hypothetical protein